MLGVAYPPAGSWCSQQHSAECVFEGADLFVGRRRNEQQTSSGSRDDAAEDSCEPVLPYAALATSCGVFAERHLPEESPL